MSIDTDKGAARTAETGAWTPEELQELAEVCRGRADIYALLARLYRIEVDGELLDVLKNQRGQSPLIDADPDDKAALGWSQISEYLAGAGDDVLTELAVDYVRSFIGAGVDGHSAAYPFESVYTDEKRLLMRDARDEVLALYLSEGLGRGESWKVGEDHIALELEFMGTLAGRAADAAAEGDAQEAGRLMTVQRAFMDDHLGAWAPMFTAEVRRFARTGLYKGLSLVTEGVLEADSELLSEVA